MAAKKAPAKKVVSKTGSANAAEKRVMDTKKQKTTRTDPAGRSGMGETVTSNVTRKVSRATTPAMLTASAAARKAIKSTKKGEDVGKNISNAYNKSLTNAQKAAGWRQDPSRPGVYVPKKKKK